MKQVTEKQRREIEYHKIHAALLAEVRKPISYDVLTNPSARWWNHYWSAYALLLKADVQGKSVLVIGCGEGLDAIRLAKLGANVYAFDISPDMLAIAKARARDEGVSVKFMEMAAENLDYRDNAFDVVVAVNILHHCNLDKCLPEIRRVAKPGAFVLVNELYTHRLLQRIRESKMGCALRGIVAPLLYPNNYSYVTEDERKLNEKDLSAVRTQLTNVRCRYFSLVVNRFLPAWDFAAKLDRVALRSLGPAGYLFAGRFILTGHVPK